MGRWSKLKGWGSKVKGRKKDIKVPGSDMLGGALEQYSRVVVKLTNWLLSWLWAMISPAVLSLPGLIILCVVILLLMYDFFVKRIIKTTWVIGETLSHIPFMFATARSIKALALAQKAVLDGMGYVVRGTIYAVMAAVKFVETGVTYGTTYFMQGGMQKGVAILSDKTELLDKAGTVADRIKTDDSDSEKETKKPVAITYTEDYDVDIERSKTLQKYDMTAEMLQYSLRFGKYWNKALAVGEVKRELLEDYYNLMNGETDSALPKTMLTTMKSSKDKVGQIKDMYYYAYKAQMDIIKAKEEEIENIKHTTELDLEKEMNKLDTELESLLSEQDCNNDIETNEGLITSVEREIETIENKYYSNKDTGEVRLEGFVEDRYKNIIDTVCKEEIREDVYKEGSKEIDEKKSKYNKKGKYNRCVDEYNEAVEMYNEENNVELDTLVNLSSGQVGSLTELKQEINVYESNLSIRADNESKAYNLIKDVEGAFYGNKSKDDTDTTNEEGTTASKDNTADYSKLRNKEMENVKNIYSEVERLLNDIESKRQTIQGYEKVIRERKDILSKRIDINDEKMKLENKISNIDYLDETIKSEYGKLQREKEKLYELLMGSELYYDLEEDGDSSNENKTNYIMDMYYKNEEVYEDLEDNIKELINLKVDYMESTFNRFVGTENGFEEMSVNDALNKMIQNRYGGYGYPKVYYTAKHNGDDVLGAKVLTYEHTMITAPEDLKLLKISMEANPENAEEMISCISFISSDYQREYRVMGIDNISKFFNAKVKLDYEASKTEANDNFEKITVDDTGRINVNKDYEAYNIVIPDGTAIGSFGSKIVTLAERRAAAERENARNRQNNTTDTTTTDTTTTGTTTGVEEYTSEKDIAIINDPHTYAQVFIELNESSRNSVLDIEPDFIIPISNKGSYRYASTLKETEDGSVAKLYGGVIKAENAGFVQDIGFDSNGEETITVSNRTYTRGKDNIISFGDRQRELLYKLDPYWSSKQYKFDNDEPDVYKGQVMGTRHRQMDGKIKDEVVKAPSGYKIVGKEISGGNLMSTKYTVTYNMYDVSNGKIVQYTLENTESAQDAQHMYKLDDDFSNHIENILKYKITDGDIIGYKIDTSVSEKEEIKPDKTIKLQDGSEIKEKFIDKFKKTSLNRNEVEIKYEVPGKIYIPGVALTGVTTKYDYCDIVEVGRDKNGMLRVKLKNNKTNEIYDYIGLSGLGQKIVDKLQLVYNKDSKEYDYGYAAWCETDYNLSNTKFSNLERVASGEGIAFVGRTIKRDAKDNKLYFDENNTQASLDVIAPENCILTKAGWSINAGWMIQLTSLDYERRYEFSGLSDFSNWIKGVIGSKVGPDWETKKYEDITIDEYRVIRKGEMVGRMGASKGPEIGDIPLIAPETLRIVQLGHRINEKNGDKEYCVKLESLDGTRQYEIIDMDIYSPSIHTRLNGDKTSANRIMSIDGAYKKGEYDACCILADPTELKDKEAYKLEIIKAEGTVKEVNKEEYTIDMSMNQLKIGEMYVYEGETIGYAKMEPIVDTIQQLAGIKSKKLKTNILVKNNSNAVTRIASANRPKHVSIKGVGNNSTQLRYYYDDAMIQKRKAREFDLFDAVHVGVLIYKFDNLPINTDAIEAKLITIDKVERSTKENISENLVDVFNISYTESEHRATKAICYDNDGNMLAVNDFEYETGNKTIKKISYYVDGDNGRKESESKVINILRNKDEDTKVTTVSDVPIYVPNGIDKVSKIRLYDSVGMYQDYNINKILKVNQDNNNHILEMNMLLAYDMEVQRIECYNEKNESIGVRYNNGSNRESEGKDNTLYMIDLYTTDSVQQIKVYTATGEILYWKPEIRSVNKKNETQIEIKCVKGMSDVSKIRYLNDIGEVIKEIDKDIISSYERAVTMQGYNVEEATRLDVISNNSTSNIKKIEVCCKDGSTVYECMGIEDVTIDKTGNINIEFSISSEDEIREAEVISKNKEVLFKKEVSGKNSVDVVVDKTKLHTIGTIVLRSKNGDNVSYTMSNRLYWAEVLDRDTVQVGCSILDKEGDFSIELLDKDMKTIGTAKVKEILSYTTEIDIADSTHTTEDVRMVVLKKGSNIEDICSILGTSSVTFNEGQCEMKIVQQKGVALKKFEFYDKYGNTTHKKELSESDKNMYKYYELSSEGKIVDGGNDSSHKFTLEPNDVGVKIYDQKNRTKEILIKPIITACRVTGEGRLQVEFYEGYGGASNMKVYGRGTKNCEATYDKLKLESGNYVYRANVSSIDIKTINVDIKNTNRYPVDIIKIKPAKDKFDADKIDKIVLTNKLGLSDEYEVFGIRSVTVEENKVYVEGSNLQDVKYVTLDGRTLSANKSNNRYTLPVGEATKIIARQTQKTYEGTYTREQVIEGPNIIHAWKVNRNEGRFYIDTKVTGGTNIGRKSSEYRASIVYFDVDGNRVDTLGEYLNFDSSNELNIKTKFNYDQDAQYVHKVRVYNANGLVSEKIVEDKTIENAELEITNASFIQEGEKTTLVATVKVSDMLEIDANDSGVIYGDVLDESLSVTVADGANKQEKKVSIDVDMSKNFGKIQVGAKYKDDSSLKKTTQYDLFRVKDVVKEGKNIKVTIQNVDAVGVDHVDYIDIESMYWNGEINWRSSYDCLNEGENIVIERMAGWANVIRIILNNGYTVEYSAPTVASAKKVDAKGNKVMLKMNVSLNEAYDIKDTIDRIELFNYDEELIIAKNNISGGENIEIELTGDEVEARKIRVITKRGFAVEKEVEDETEAGNTIQIDSIERSDEGYKINIKRPKNIYDIGKVFVRYRDDDKENEVTLHKGQYIDKFEVVSVMVEDVNGKRSEWYDLVKLTGVENVDGGVKIVFERNLCDIAEIMWIDNMQAKDIGWIGNVTEYTIEGEHISYVEIHLDNGQVLKREIPVSIDINLNKDIIKRAPKKT